mgnify:CR=1 FL=1
MAEEFTPIFVGGTGRSGTTIILNMLKSHPHFHSSMPRELRYITDRKGLIDFNFKRSIKREESVRGVRNLIASKILTLTGKGPAHVLVQRMQGVWWSQVGKKGKPRGLVQGVSAPELEAALKVFLKAQKRDKMQASRELFYSLSSKQFQKDGVKFFADSTPINMMNADYIFKIFPEGKFINMVRDGRDVAYSVSRERWGPNDPYEALAWWEKRIRLAQSALSQLPDHQKIELRLEDLVVRNREATYAKLFQFIGLPDEGTVRKFFDEEMLPERMHEGAWQSEVSDPEKYQKMYEKILQSLQRDGISVEKFY